MNSVPSTIIRGLINPGQKMVVVDVISGISGESNERSSGGMVDCSESKTLAENPSDKGSLIEGVRVSADSKVLDGESNTENVISEIGKEYVEYDRLKINDKLDISKSQMISRNNRWDSWESWGVMNMVDRVLGGKFSIDEDDKVQDVNSSSTRREASVREMESVTPSKSGCESDVVELEKMSTSKNGCESNVGADTNTWQSVIGEPVTVDKTDVEGSLLEKDLDDLISDYLVLETGLEGGQNSDELISDYFAEGTGLNLDKDSDGLILECLAEVTGLKGGKDSSEVVDGIGLNVDEESDELVDGTDLNVDKDSDELVDGTDLNVDKESDELVDETGVNVDKESDELVGGTHLNGDKESDELVDGTGLNGDKESDELIFDCLADRNGTEGEQNSLFRNLAPDGTSLNGDHQELLSTDEVIDVKVEAFSRTRGEHQMTEKEGEYYVSDLVWGKVKGHPWWPGQIFPLTAGSDKAAKHFRKRSYLIAYFGDQTFAWNEVSHIKPFRMYFSRLEKQSNSDGFCHAVSCALDEVIRRVEFGLSCPCLSEEVRDKIKIQVVSNAGIKEDKNIVDDVDNLSSAASFLPGNLVDFLESVAECPQSKTDRLRFTIAKYQLLAFSRWKGHYTLPVFEEYVGLLEDDTEVTVKGMDSLGDYFSSRKRKSTAQDGSFQKHKHPSGGKESPIIKEKRISILMSSNSSTLPNVDEKSLKKSGKRPVSAGQNSEGTNSLVSNLKAKRRKILLPASPVGDGEKNLEAKLRFFGESELVEIIPAEIPTPDVIRSKLISAAKVPMRGFNIMISEIDFLREFRNLVCLEIKSSYRNTEMDTGKCKEKESPKCETANTFGLEGTKDSYWTDRIIQNYSQDQELFDLKNPNDEALQIEEEEAGIKKNDAAVVNLGSEKLSEEYQPTALILNFTDLDSIPSVMNLNEIFKRYGPLNEQETEILRKSKRVKVIFKRRADAETAFSSTGKYSTFGPSLISYKLNYAPTPRKIRRASNRSKKDTSPKVDA